MNEHDIVERIKFLMKELSYKQQEFARKIDVDPSNLSKYLNGHLPVSDSLVNRIVVNLGVSKRWLEEGDDLPFAKQIQPPTSTIVMTADSKSTQGTPVYDIDVTAGTLPRARMFTDDQIIGYVALPGIDSTGCRIVKVSGDSMSPVIREGDYLAVRELTNFQQIFWGQIYVILLDDYRLVKYIRRHDDPKMVILRSENPKYDDMDIYRTDIRDLMFVQHILHLDTRM